MPTDTATEKVVQAKTEKLEPAWVAIIYRSAKESVSVSDEFDDRPVPQKRSPLWLSVGIAKNNTATGMAEVESIQFRPGANLGVLLHHYHGCLANALIKSTFDDGILEAVFPIAGRAQDPDYIRYSAFNDEDAIRLIKATTHESWLEEWSQDETRPAVIKATNKQLEFIRSKKAQKQAA
jgi:hypothetical protein